MRLIFVVFFVLIPTLRGFTEEKHHEMLDTQSPYAGMEQRQIKALSGKEITDLKAGRGMSFALAAELNGFPGPKHVLELARQLAIDPVQWTTTEKLFNEMQTEAKRLGEELILAETKLDHLFAERTATPEAITTATALAAAAQGSLRASHLRYHLRMLAVLTPDQAATYRRLRGYK